MVWKDRQERGSAAFDRMKPSNPMTCTMLVVKRLEKPKEPPRFTGQQIELIRQLQGDIAIVPARHASMRVDAGYKQTLWISFFSTLKCREEAVLTSWPRSGPIRP